jgi:hypothetical protein
MKQGRRTFTAAYKTQLVLGWIGNSSASFAQAECDGSVVKDTALQT